MKHYLNNFLFLSFALGNYVCLNFTNREICIKYFLKDFLYFSLALGDYVCQELKWKKKYVKVEVRSEAGCRGQSRSSRRISALEITNNLCCKRIAGVWKGVECKARKPTPVDIFG